MTITEALAEVKTINARLEKKRESIMRYFSRDARLKDPLTEDGGSHTFVRRERQGIADLEERVISIRSAIQAVNLNTRLTVAEKTRSIADWLVWRREISEGAKTFLAQMTSTLNTVRQEASRRGYTLSEKDSDRPAQEIFVAVNESQLAAEVEGMETLLGDLDGKLSLVNATTFVEV